MRSRSPRRAPTRKGVRGGGGRGDAGTEIGWVMKGRGVALTGSGWQADGCRQEWVATFLILLVMPLAGE